MSHWSARLLADHLGGLGIAVSFSEVARIWRDKGLQPHRVETFKFSTDPALEAKIRFNASEQRTHDYVQHGTTTLFAALEVATGRITADACYDRHRNDEFLAFLKTVAKAHPRVALHVVADNYATHNHPNVKAWLANNPRITLHFTPTSASWMNMVEIFFGIITRQAIRRDSSTSVKDLTSAIRAFIDAYNERCQPFAWIKTADQILTKADRRQPACDTTPGGTS